MQLPMSTPARIPAARDDPGPPQTELDPLSARASGFQCRQSPNLGKSPCFLNDIDSSPPKTHTRTSPLTTTHEHLAQQQASHCLQRRNHTKMPSIRLLTRPTLRQTHHQRLLRTTTALTRPYSSAFQQGPSPPRLPADQQAEFERLQRAVSERIADPTPLPHEQQQQSTPAPSPASTSRHASTPTAAQTVNTTKKADDDVLPTAVRRGAKPEFDGDTNPKTGEVGGPKNEPLRWGSGGDWSYNGRVTDF